MRTAGYPSPPTRQDQMLRPPEVKDNSGTAGPLAGRRLRDDGGTGTPAGRPADHDRGQPGGRRGPIRIGRRVRGLPRRSLRLPASRPRVSLVVIDTDVASALLRRRASDELARALAGQVLAITFVTVGELTKWTLVRHWGPRSLATMRTFLGGLVILPYDQRVSARWGELQAYAQLRGRPRPTMTVGSPLAASCASSRSRRSTSRTSRTSPSTRASSSSVSRAAGAGNAEGAWSHGWSELQDSREPGAFYRPVGDTKRPGRRLGSLAPSTS